MTTTRLIPDTLVMAERALVRLPRSPDLLLGFTVQPVMFVLLFAYVFGGAIETPGFDYVEFLIPGIVVQNIAFAGFATALGLAEDMTKGLVDRFRSLPTARASVLAGRALADVVTTLVAIAVLLGTGFVIGFGLDASALEVLAGIALLLLFGFASTWVFALIGLSVSSPEAANGLGFTIVFPVTFISSAFVPVASMPAGLEWVAAHNPVTVVVDALRTLWLGAPGGDPLAAIAWSLALVAVFAPLAVRKYRSAAARSGLSRPGDRSPGRSPTVPPWPSPRRRSAPRHRRSRPSTRSSAGSCARGSRASCARTPPSGRPSTGSPTGSSPRAPSPATSG